MSDESDVPHWEQVYRTREIEGMPWFYPALDPDLEQALEARSIRSGRVLDLGTGPGTQAIALAQRGFEVTGTDLSETAVDKARQRAAEQGVAVDFRQDDILHSRLEQPFDVVLDRGCFHVMSPDQRADYVAQVQKLVRPGGFLFLKTFSHKQPGTQGPNRFRPEEIEALFSGPFQVHSITETVYQGTLQPLPIALFSVLERR